MAAGCQCNSSNTLPKHSNNVAINQVMETTEGQADIVTKNDANVGTHPKTTHKLSFGGSFTLFLSRIRSKKWKELPKQLNRNTADVEWRAGGDGVDRSRKMGNGQTASLRAKRCFSCYFSFRYIECTLYIFMMWIWFYKTIDIPVGGFQNLRTKKIFYFARY